MRAFAVCLLTIVVSSVLGIHAVESAAAKLGCNGLLAFSSNRTEDANAQIYSLSLDGHRTNLTRYPVAWNAEPRPSPDGTELAYWSDGALVVSALDGSNPRPMVPPPGTFPIEVSVTWAPDSKRLAVAVDVTNPPGGELVVVFDAATGAATSLGPGWDPHWSPNGSAIAFVGDAPGNVQTVFVSRPDGFDRRPIAIGNAPAWFPDSTRLLVGQNVFAIDGSAPVAIEGVAPIAWTPDGSRIVGYGPGGALVSASADGSDLHVIAQAARVGHEVLSPDGRLVVFERTDSHVIVADLDGQVVRDLGAWPPPPMTFWEPHWSPDSSKVLLWSGGNVLVTDVDTGTIETLAGGPTDTTGQPIWAPNGTVLDSISDATGNTDIYVSNPDGTGVRRVFGDAVPEHHPVWSPDGKQIAFLRYGSPATLVVTNIAGPARTLLRDPGLARFDPTSYSALGVTGLGPPAWSSDGKTIAVASTTNAGIDFVDVRTGKVRSFGTTDDAYPAFSPDGRSIAYATPNLNGGEDVVVAPRTRHGGRSWRVHAGEVYSEEDQEPGLVEDIRWSPDGKRLSFIRFAQGEYGPFGYSTRTLDSHTHRVVAKSPLVFENSGFSPDGRFVAVPGIDTRIAHPDGGTVATLHGLRSVEVSWQPLCKAMP